MGLSAPTPQRSPAPILYVHDVGSADQAMCGVSSSPSPERRNWYMLANCVPSNRTSQTSNSETNASAPFPLGHYTVPVPLQNAITPGQSPPVPLAGPNFFPDARATTAFA